MTAVGIPWNWERVDAHEVQESRLSKTENLNKGVIRDFVNMVACGLL